MSAPGIGSCAEMETLLAERASGPLEAPVAATLEKHLVSCARCRAAAERWETLFSLVALTAPKLKEEAAMRDLPQHALLAWQRRERRWRRVPAVAAVALLAAAALLLVLWHSPGQPQAPLAVVADSTQPLQLEWTDGPTWEMDEPDATEAAPDDATLLDGLALEGDGAFSLGDSG
jgi:anti-sigma factor RsiW